jgi:hypothetical protein
MYLKSATGPGAATSGLLTPLLLQLLMPLGLPQGTAADPPRPSEQNCWTSCLLGAVPGAPRPRIPAAPRRRGDIACKEKQRRIKWTGTLMKYKLFYFLRCYLSVISHIVLYFPHSTYSNVQYVDCRFTYTVVNIYGAVCHRNHIFCPHIVLFFKKILYNCNSLLCNLVGNL